MQATRTQRYGGLALTVAVGLAAALPVIVSTARALAEGWMPVGDQGMIAARAFDVLTAHSPLVGQYSFASRVAGHPTYSPGPLLYWLLALPARIGPLALPLAMGLVNAAAIVAAVALVRRRGGVPLMLAAALALALMCRSLSSENLHDVFNPAAGVLPFTLLVFACWSLACGERWLLPAAAALASFVVQCHLGFLAPTLGVLAVALTGLAISRPARLRRPLAAAMAVLVVCWAAPVAQQLTHSPGNMRLLVTAATSRRGTQGAGPAWRGVARAAGVPPRFLRAPGYVADHVGVVSGGDYGDTRLNDILTPPSGLQSVSAAALLLALVAAGALALRRRRLDVAAAAAIGLVLCGAFAAVIASTPGAGRNTLGYSMWWGSTAGMWVWLTLAWSAATLSGLDRRRVPMRAAAFAAGAVALVGLAVAATGKPDAHRADYRPVRTLAAGLDHVSGGSVWFRQLGVPLVPIAPALQYELRRRGVRPLGEYSPPLFGSWYALDGHSYRSVVTVAERGAAEGGVARALLRDSRGSHLLTLAVRASGGQRRPPG